MIWIAPSEKDTDAATLEKRRHYYDLLDATGRFDIVLASAPFNVNVVDTERLKDMVGPNRGFPIRRLRTDNAN